MRTSTSRYRFEYRLLDWSQEWSRNLCGSRTGFFIGLRSDGGPRRVYFAPPDLPFDGDRKTKLVEAHSRWFLYTPHDDLRTGYLEWLDLDQAAAERWVGRRFEVADFLDVRSTSTLESWPCSWRVIVG